jgi:MFS transporter, DHA1 family, tetracycline resistance protein
MKLNKNIIPAILLTFVNVLGFSILIPVLPFVIDQYGLSQVWYGVLLSSYAIALFFGAPLLGALSDRFGRKPLLIVSHLGTLLSWCVFAVAYFIPGSIILFGLPVAVIIILFSRMLDGITGGNNSVVSALITDVTKPDERGKAFGLMGATFGVGFMIGPLLGGLSYQVGFGYLGTILLAMLISIITLIAIVKYVKTPIVEKSEESWQKIAWRKLNIFKTLSRYRNRVVVRSTLAIKLFVVLAFSGFTSVVSLHLMDYFYLSAGGVGMFMFAIGIYSILNQGFLVPRIIKKLKGPKALLLGSVFLAVGLLAVSLAPHLWLFVALAYLFSFGVSIIFPTIKTILSLEASDREQGEVLGLDESIQSIAQAVMPFVSATLYVVFGKVIFIGFSLFVVVTVIPFIVMILLRRNKKLSKYNNEKVRATAVIIKNNKVLLIHRFRDGNEYFVLPGGSVENKESTEVAVVREVKEETNLEVKINKKIGDYFDEFEKRKHCLYKVTVLAGELRLSGPELLRDNDKNKYVLEWCGLEHLNDLLIYPKSVKEALKNL